MKINDILPDKHKYLQSITSIAKPPDRLYYIGKIPATRIPTIAVVGTRKPTAYGREVTQTLVADLARHGIVIVSGLALGVDAIAHAATLEAQGTTLAILPGALNHIQPSTNRGLAEQIVKCGGALLSEHSIDDDYRIGKWSFLQRNRLVAGISDAILITEAGVRSGTLNTAMYALEQGKDVFVVPGNITSPQSAGCNQLIRQGAIPVTSAQDILDILVPNLQPNQTHLAFGVTPIETAIIEALASGLRDADEIQRQTHINPVELNTSLTMLEIQGTIRSLGANQWTLR